MRNFNLERYRTRNPLPKSHENNWHLHIEKQLLFPRNCGAVNSMYELLLMSEIKRGQAQRNVDFLPASLFEFSHLRQKLGNEAMAMSYKAAAVHSPF